ncbi:MAG: DNA polymerase I [Lachnospiraceae bacterium]|nr:DNA polymerase I [Lachnospiraceae bacterium]
MGEKLVLIDGHSILNRAFYGLPDLTNSEGMHTNAVYGFLNIMLKILEEEKPDYFTVAFDVKHPTFRHEMYQEYKGTRKGMPDELKEQVPVIQDVLKAMGVPIVMQAGFEADDILGSLAKQAESKGMEVSLVSGDRDLLQLATDSILIRIPKTKRGGTEIENYHTQEVIDKYGLTPPQIIDLKGLMGDASDNIPGVPGVGEKTAVKILTAFPTVEEAYEHIEEVEPKRARELLREHRELAFLSKKLATIKTDCELDFSWEDAKLGDLFTTEAFAWVKRLELKSLLKYFDGAAAAAVAPKFDDFKWIASKKEWDALIKEICKQKPEQIGVAFLGDTWMGEGAIRKKQSKRSGGQMSLVLSEDGLELTPGEDENDVEYGFLGLSVSYGQGEQAKTNCVLVSESVTGEVLLEGYRSLESVTEEIVLLDWKNTLHLTKPMEKSRFGVEPGRQQGFKMDSEKDRAKTFSTIRDLQIGAYLLNPLKDTYLVDDIARDYLEYTLPSYQELFGKEKLAELLQESDEAVKKKLLEYFGYLSCIPLLAWKEMRSRLEEQNMLSLMQDIEMPTVYYLFEMERLGVQADRDTLTDMSKLLEQKVLALETDIYDLAGEEFNINSPKQLGVILFEKMKLPFAKKTKTGYSTSADILEKLRTEDPIVDKILEYRQVSKLKSTYADGLPVFIEEDHRIHGKFNQTITATGRISSTDPNLQNIPIRMDLGRQLRKVFEPQEGCVFLDADYSQIELRVLAHMSGDEHLIEAYRQGQDIHRATASKVFHTPFDEVTDLQRRNAKAVNFGIVYGISAFGLSQDLDVSRKEAEEIIAQYFAGYPAIKEFLDGLVAQAKKKGYAETMFGRRRPVPELTSSNFMQRSFGERVAMNSPIQGTAADIIKIAMVRVAERLQKENLHSRIVLQVHDELLVETWKEEREQVRKILLEEMPAAAQLKVPLDVEVEEGVNWYEAH